MKLDQPDMVANSARGQLNRKNVFPLSPFAPENLVSQDRFGRPVAYRTLVLKALTCPLFVPL